jgi:hypothetical protein
MSRITATTALAASAFIVLTACGGGSDDEGDVSRSQFQADGKEWPLTVDSGTVACEPGSRLTFTSDDTTYAINGLAKGDGEWAEIDPIWAYDGSGLGLKVDISDLIEAGQALC